MGLLDNLSTIFTGAANKTEHQSKIGVRELGDTLIGQFEAATKTADSDFDDKASGLVAFKGSSNNTVVFQHDSNSVFHDGDISGLV